MDHPPVKLSGEETGRNKNVGREKGVGKSSTKSSRQSPSSSKVLSSVDVSKLKDVKVRMVRAGTYLVPGKGLVKTPEKKHKTILNSMRKSPVKKAMDEKQDKSETKNKVNTDSKDKPPRLSPKKQAKTRDMDSKKSEIPDIVVTPAKQNVRSPRKNSASKKKEKTENEEQVSRGLSPKSSQRASKQKVDTPKVRSRTPSKSPSPNRRKKNSSPDKNTSSLNVDHSKPGCRTRSPNTKNADKANSKESVKKSPSKSPKPKGSPKSGSSSRSSSSSKKSSVSDDSATPSSSSLCSTTPESGHSPLDRSGAAVKKLFTSDDDRTHKTEELEQPVFDGLENCSITVDHISLGMLKSYNYKYSLTTEGKSSNSLSDLIAKVNSNIETPNHECNEMFGKAESLDLSDEILSPERVGEMSEFNDSMDSDKTVTEFEVQGDSLATIPEEDLGEASKIENIEKDGNGDKDTDKTDKTAESVPSDTDTNDKTIVETKESDTVTEKDNVDTTKEDIEKPERMEENLQDDTGDTDADNESPVEEVSIFEHFGLKLRKNPASTENDSAKESQDDKNKEENNKDPVCDSKTNNESDVVVIPDSAEDDVLVISDEDSATNSPAKKKKFPCVNHVVEPKPIHILTNVERQIKDKRVAFHSEELEEYIDVNKENMGPLYRNVEEKSEGSSSAKTSPLSKEFSCSPDLDEVEGFMFVSFSSGDALKAHMELENKVDWLNEGTLKKLAQLKIMKEKQLDEGKRRVTDVKSMDQQKQNFRGLHMKYTKYQKLLKREYDDLTQKDMCSLKTPEKTSDITKIKGWKNKFKSPEELQEAARLNLMESGKLHWRTEDRLLRNLNSDDMKDIGLDLKRKRRKMINYSKRKIGQGKHSGKKRKDDIDLEHLVDEDAITEADVYNEDDDKPPPDKIPYSEKYHSQHKYGQRKLFVKRMKLDATDERILKKLGTTKLYDKESGSKAVKCKVVSFNKITQLMAVAAVSAFDKKLFNKAKRLDKSPIRRTRLSTSMKDELDGDSEQTEHTGYNTDEHKDEEEEVDEHVASDKDQKQTDKQTTATRERRDKERKKSLEKCDQPGCRYGCICHLCKLSDSGEEKESEKKPACDKEYCKLGCICDSIETKQNKEPSGHCRKPACMFECKCPPKQPKPDIPKARGRRKKKGQPTQFKRKTVEPADVKTEEIEMKEEIPEEIEKEDDWEPPASKKKKRSGSGNRFANLPKRESTYRLAKNLDAVSRKAMIVYESSEMYAEQKIRRRRSDALADPMDDYFFDDPYGDFVGTGYFPPTVSGKEKTKTSTKQAHRESSKVSSGGPGVFEISDESDDNTSITDDSGICARSTMYSGDYNVNRYKKKHESGSSTASNSAQPSVSNRMLTQTTNEVIELPDSDDDTNNKQTKKAVSQLTVSQRLGLARKKESQMEASKWKTQMVCLKAKKRADDKSTDPQSEIKLLEIISNCNWEMDRTNMLSKISHIISKEYAENYITMWQNYVLQFLPKADKPAVIPPELQSKLPNSMYSIRVRVTQNISDIEKAENDVKEGADKEDISEENMKHMTDEERKKFCIKQQGKLIEKIKFAERLRDLIKNEEGKGISSKFSVSLEGIEKALKRYKTQLYKAYTGTSNKSLTQIKHAIQALKHAPPTSTTTQHVKSGAGLRNENLMMPSGCGVSMGTLSRLQSNQGLKIHNSVTLPSGQKSFIAIDALKSNSTLAGGNITIKNQDKSHTQLQPNPHAKMQPVMKVNQLSTSGTSLIAKPLSSGSQPLVAAKAPLMTAQTLSNPASDGMSATSTKNVINNKGNEVFLIPVQDKNSGKWDPKVSPVFTAKVTMISGDGTAPTLKNNVVNLTPVPTTAPLKFMPPRFISTVPGPNRFPKPMLNPALTAYANAPVLPGNYHSKAPPGATANTKILFSSLQQITSGSPIMSQVQSVMSQRMSLKPPVAGQMKTVTPVGVCRPQVPNTSPGPAAGSPANVRANMGPGFNVFPPIRYAAPFLNSATGQVNLRPTTTVEGKQMILLSSTAGSVSLPAQTTIDGQAMIAVPVSSITPVVPPTSKPVHMVNPHTVTTSKTVWPPHPASPHPASPHPASPHPASPHPASPHPASPHPASPITVDEQDSAAKTDLIDNQIGTDSSEQTQGDSSGVNENVKPLGVTVNKSGVHESSSASNESSDISGNANEVTNVKASTCGLNSASSGDMHKDKTQITESDGGFSGLNEQDTDVIDLCAAESEQNSDIIDLDKAEHDQKSTVIDLEYAELSEIQTEGIAQLEQLDTIKAESSTQGKISSDISDTTDIDKLTRKRKGDLNESEPPSKHCKQDNAIEGELASSCVNQESLAEIGNPSKLVKRRCSAESEGSDIDIMSFDDQVTDVPKLPVPFSRRKPQHTMSLIKDDFSIKQMKVKKSKTAKTKRHGSMHLNQKDIICRQRRVLIKRNKDELSKVTFKYNEEIRQFSSVIPTHFVLTEAHKLIKALEQKEGRLTESLADGTQYQLSLKNKLQSQIDSLVRRGVPEQVIQNFLKGISKATLSLYPKTKKTCGISGGELEDCDTDLDYQQLSTSEVLTSKNTFMAKVFGALGEYPSSEKDDSQHSEDHSSFILNKLESVDSGVYVDNAEQDLTSNCVAVDRVVSLDSGSEDEIRSSTGDVPLDNSDIIEDEGGGYDNVQSAVKTEFVPVVKTEPLRIGEPL